MPDTPARKAARARATKASQDAAARRRAEKAASQAAPAPGVSFTAPPEPDDAGAEDVIQFDAAKILRYGLNAPHDAMAVLTGHDEMRLSKTEEAVLSSTVMTSLELVGWVRFVVYLAPLAAIMVLLAIEGGRLKILRQMWEEKRIAREIAAAEADGRTFVQNFEDEVRPAREARQAETAQTRRQPAPGMAARGVDPTELTYLEEEAV